MTVESKNNKTEATLLAGSVNFPLTFYFDNESDIKVYVDSVATPTGWSVSGAGSKTTNGIVTFLSPFSENKLITVLREIEPKQQVDLKNGGVMDAEVLEQMHDKITMITQQLSEKLERTVTVQPGKAGLDANALLQTLDNTQQSTTAHMQQAFQYATEAQNHSNAASSSASAAANSVNQASQIKQDTEAIKDTLEQSIPFSTQLGDASTKTIGTGPDQVPLNSMVDIQSQLGPVIEKLQRLEVIIASLSDKDTSVYTTAGDSFVDEYTADVVMARLDQATIDVEKLDPFNKMVVANFVQSETLPDDILSGSISSYLGGSYVSYDSGTKILTSKHPYCGGYINNKLNTKDIAVLEFEVNSIPSGTMYFGFGDSNSIQNTGLGVGSGLFLGVSRTFFEINVHAPGARSYTHKRYVPIPDGSRFKFMLNFNTRIAYVYMNEELIHEYDFNKIYSGMQLNSTVSLFPYFMDKYGVETAALFNLLYMPITGMKVKNLKYYSFSNAFNTGWDNYSKLGKFMLGVLSAGFINYDSNKRTLNTQPESASVVLDIYGGSNFVFGHLPNVVGGAVIRKDYPFHYIGDNHYYSGSAPNKGDYLIYDTGDETTKQIKMCGYYNINYGGYERYAAEFSGSNSPSGPWTSLLKDEAACFGTPSNKTVTDLSLVTPTTVPYRYIRAGGSDATQTDSYFTVFNEHKAGSDASDMQFQLSRDDGTTWINVPLSLFNTDSDYHCVLKGNIKWPENSPAGKDLRYRVIGGSGLFAVKGVSVDTAS